MMNNNDSTSKLYTKSQQGGSNQKLKNVNSNIASNRDYFNDQQGFQNNTEKSKHDFVKKGTNNNVLKGGKKGQYSNSSLTKSNSQRKIP